MEWLNQIADEGIRNDPSVKSFKDVTELARSHVNAQKLIGQNRLPAPDKSWKPEQWDSFWNQVGRPEKPDGYKVPETVKLREGLTIAEDKKKAMFENLHKLGLPQQQFEGVYQMYIDSLNTAFDADKTMREQTLASGLEKLRTQHGDKFDGVVQLANSTITKFAGDDGEFVNFLKSSGLANDPRMVNFMYQVGMAMSEDTMRTGGTAPQFAGDQGTALKEILKLEKDEQFQKAYNNKYDPGHQEAIDRMLHLNRIAYPGKVS